MTATATPTTTEDLLTAIDACLENGQRLLDETYDLEFRDPSATRLFLIMIAQEEFAKAFILFLAKEGIAHLNPAVLRAIKDHTCKQLVGMIMDYIIMHWDEVEEMEELVRRDCELGERLPNDVGSAMDILRYEKIGRWENCNWVWAEDPQYDRTALRISKGHKDRRKQDALYVRVDRNGRVCSTPKLIHEEEVQAELARAGRFKMLLASMVDGTADSARYDKAMSALRMLFQAS